MAAELCITIQGLHALHILHCHASAVHCHKKEANVIDLEMSELLDWVDFKYVNVVDSVPS
jgi:hypothetical protein